MIGKVIRYFLFSALAITLTACSSTQQTQPRTGMSYDLTLLVIPRTEEAVQVAFDIGVKGYPIILVAYEEVDGQVQIHAWDGVNWVKVAPDAYKAGTFFRAAPKQAVLVGTQGKDVPSELIPSSTWCQQIYRTDSDDTANLLNFLGTGLKFSYPHWKWFADRYGYKVSEINPQYLGDKWYYHNLSDYYNRVTKGIDYDAEPEPEVTNVVEEMMPMDMPVEKEPTIEEADLDKQVEVIENPLETEEIPAAEEVVEEVQDDASMTE